MKKLISLLMLVFCVSCGDSRGPLAPDIILPSCANGTVEFVNTQHRDFGAMQVTGDFGPFLVPHGNAVKWNSVEGDRSYFFTWSPTGAGSARSYSDQVYVGCGKDVVYNL